jgi:isoleucyl-tRNA synthetase
LAVKYPFFKEGEKMSKPKKNAPSADEKITVTFTVSDSPDREARAVKFLRWWIARSEEAERAALSEEQQPKS